MWTVTAVSLSSDSRNSTLQATLQLRVGAFVLWLEGAILRGPSRDGLTCGLLTRVPRTFAVILRLNVSRIGYCGVSFIAVLNVSVFCLVAMLIVVRG